MNNFQVIPALKRQEIPLVALLVERCVCCWLVAHPDQPYPATWSSTLCLPHALWTRKLQRRKPTSNEAEQVGVQATQANGEGQR